MDWKGLIAIFMAVALAGLGSFSGRCTNELFMICTAIVGGVFGLARTGGGDRKIHNEINQNPAPPLPPT